MRLMYYWRTLRKTSKLLQEKQFDQCLEYLDEVLEEYPEFKTEIYYYKLVVYAELKQDVMILELIDEVVSSGGWFHEALFDEKDISEKNKESFKLLMQQAMDNKMKDSKETILEVHGSLPLFVALHGQSSILSQELEVLKSIEEAGYQIIQPQTYNRYWSGITTGYWPEYNKSLSQIEAQLPDFTLPCITGGLSMGGGLAIVLALSGRIPCKGFIVVAPGGIHRDDPEQWRDLIDASPNKEIKGLIIRGTEDQAISLEYTETLVEILNEKGVEVQFMQIEGLGHWYPDNLKEIIESFISTL
ncbi:MAG: hypothetical protein INQ03_15455 [Candidatus Heimdallarchaeota archaeon]|nr:hypothetical protein [Candidatus Heimdallarchaeota archaeon]